jgi:hypothetical protein
LGFFYKGAAPLGLEEIPGGDNLVKMAFYNDVAPLALSAACLCEFIPASPMGATSL